MLHLRNHAGSRIALHESRLAANLDIYARSVCHGVDTHVQCPRLWFTRTARYLCQPKLLLHVRTEPAGTAIGNVPLFRRTGLGSDAIYVVSDPNDGMFPNLRNAKVKHVFSRVDPGHSSHFASLMADTVTIHRWLQHFEAVLTLVANLTGLDKCSVAARKSSHVSNITITISTLRRHWERVHLPILLHWMSCFGTERRGQRDIMLRARITHAPLYPGTGLPRVSQIYPHSTGKDWKLGFYLQYGFAYRVAYYHILDSTSHLQLLRYTPLMSV
jgi:hypothetical protein